MHVVVRVLLVSSFPDECWTCSMRENKSPHAKSLVQRKNRQLKVARKDKRQKTKMQKHKTQTLAQKATHPAHLTLYLLATQPTISHESPSCNQRPHSAYIPTSQVPNLLPISQDFRPRPRTPYNTTRPPTHLRTYRFPQRRRVLRRKNMNKCGQSHFIHSTSGRWISATHSHRIRSRLFLSGAPQSHSDREYCGVNLRCGRDELGVMRIRVNESWTGLGR